MSKSNKKVMSIAIRPELHEELKKHAKRRGLSTSSYVGDLVEESVKIDIDEEPMIVAICPELHEELKMHSKNRNMSDSEYVVDLIEKSIKIGMDKEPMIIAKPLDEEVLPVILKVPKLLLENGDSEEL